MSGLPPWKFQLIDAAEMTITNPLITKILLTPVTSALHIYNDVSV